LKKGRTGRKTFRVRIALRKGGHCSPHLRLGTGERGKIPLPYSRWEGRRLKEKTFLTGKKKNIEWKSANTFLSQIGREEKKRGKGLSLSLVLKKRDSAGKVREIKAPEKKKPTGIPPVFKCKKEGKESFHLSRKHSQARKEK